MALPEGPASSLPQRLGWTEANEMAAREALPLALIIPEKQEL
jgi:hypothetical protein